MPIHDWTQVRANRFHDFHQSWTLAIRNALNSGLLPDGFFALAEQRTGGPEPDFVTLSDLRQPPAANGGVAVAAAPLRTRYHTKADAERYAEKANRIVVHHPDGDVIAVIEVVSPGNKSSRNALRMFARKSTALLRAGIHLLVVDLFPPTKRDPRGIHPVIWERFADDDEFALPADKRLTLAAYCAGTEYEAFVEPVGVGDVMRDMPIFLSGTHYVPVPLEATYQVSWDVFPKALKPPLESPASPAC